MGHNKVLLGTYPLQKDMRIRLPKQILNNLPIEIGTLIDIYLNPQNEEIILRVTKKKAKTEDLHGK